MSPGGNVRTCKPHGRPGSSYGDFARLRASETSSAGGAADTEHKSYGWFSFERLVPCSGILRSGLNTVCRKDERHRIHPSERILLRV